jgi:CheY-like chemotaxis protein
MKIEDFPEELFEQQVQSCLQHLYDYSYLQDQALVQWLFRADTGLDPVEAFREAITEIVEKLRPGASTSSHSRDARIYNLLTLRYIDQQDTSDVIAQMSLSTRQFYRENDRAIHAVGQMLRARVDKLAADNVASATTASIESEVVRAHRSAEQTYVNLNDLLENVVAAVQTLAMERNLTITMASGPDPIELEIDRGLLRQTLIWIVSQILTFAEPNTQLEFGAEHMNGAARVTITFRGVTQKDINPLEASGDTLNLFVKTLEAELIYQVVSSNVGQAILDLPIKERTILVIDDNPDLIDLFRRYLANQSYRLVSSQIGSESFQLARDLQPDFIILDIMLPGQDGLELLQNFKSHVSTRQIPVLVCSVLNARELAISFGADDFLQKPPGQADLLKILEQWQAAAH